MSFTSGKTHSDPEPWVSRKTGARYVVVDAAPESVKTWGMDYAPRPEFDNHNPILSDFRENHDENWDRSNPNYGDVSLAGYLAEIDGFVWGRDWSPALQRAWKDHARRVLTKLGALTTTPNGVTD